MCVCVRMSTAGHCGLMSVCVCVNGFLKMINLQMLQSINKIQHIQYFGNNLKLNMTTQDEPP